MVEKFGNKDAKNAGNCGRYSNHSGCIFSDHEPLSDTQGYCNTNLSGLAISCKAA